MLYIDSGVKKSVEINDCKTRNGTFARKNMGRGHLRFEESNYSIQKNLKKDFCPDVFKVILLKSNRGNDEMLKLLDYS